MTFWWNDMRSQTSSPLLNFGIHIHSIWPASVPWHRERPHRYVFITVIIINMHCVCNKGAAAGKEKRNRYFIVLHICHDNSLGLQVGRRRVTWTGAHEFRSVPTLSRADDQPLVGNLVFQNSSFDQLSEQRCAVIQAETWVGLLAVHHGICTTCAK